MSETDEGAGEGSPESPEPASEGSLSEESPPSGIADTMVIPPVPPVSGDTDVAVSPKGRRRGATAVAAVACGAIVGAGTWLGLGILDNSPELTATEQLDEWDQPGSAGDATEEVEAPWTVAWDATFEPVLVPYTPDYLAAPAVFDDGLDHASLPPLVERTSPRYPEAHELTDTVWEAAGPGWMLASYSDPDPCGIPLPGAKGAEPVFDLVSPEGIHFRLASPIGATDSYGSAPDYYSVQYANLSEGWAIVTAFPQSCYEGGGGDQSVLFDLRTGGVISMVGTDDMYSDARGTIEALGPLAGGAEVRLRHRRQEEPEPGDGLFIWTPGEGEVAVEIPEGIALGELSILGIADADAGIVVLETPNSWAGNWDGLASSDRFYLLDAITRELREVFPVVPDGVVWLEYIGLTPTALLERSSFRDANGDYQYSAALLPFNGSAPSEMGMDEAYRLALEPHRLVPVVECPDDYCAIMAVNGSNGSTVLAPLPDPISYSLSSIDATPWGDGLQTAIADQYWPPIVVEYDPGSGARLEPFSFWMPDTGARTGLISVFVFPPTPDEG